MKQIGANTLSLHLLWSCMSELPSRGSRQSRNTVFTALANQRRRAVLRIIQRLSYADIDELAAHLVATESDKPLLDVTPREAEEVKTDLTHIHLPHLVDAGLLTNEDGVITTTQHPALQDPKITAMIEVDTPEWDEVLRSIADKQRRIMLTALFRSDEPMDKETLATAVTEKIQEESDTPVTVEEVLLQMNHIHLPMLESTGLVTSDGEMVTYQGHPHLYREWLIAGADDTPRAILSMADHSADIWTLEGRDNVTERGRALCESAEEELFIMLTIEGTVETACFRRIQDALDRGVDIYLGTQNKEIRDLVRKHAPEVTIWEPQLDWLNLPPEREKVGRLILADREEILIGTIGDDDPNGIPNETAITGAGADNPLVVLLREMLGSRLDHLDAQSADFRSEIPL